MPHAAAEARAHVLEQQLVGLVEAIAQLVGDRLAAIHHVPHRHAEPDGGLGALALLRWLCLDCTMRERVDLLEHARHGRKVGGLDLGQLGDDLLGVAAEVGELAAESEGGELDEQRV